MTWELAKKLKGYGFPQQAKKEGWTDFYDIAGQVVGISNMVTHNPDYYTKIPDPLELIEWCGDQFEILIRRVHWDEKGIKDYSTIDWVAYAFNKATGHGKTAEEALINLGILLHAKETGQ